MSGGSPVKNGISVEPGLPKIVVMPNRRMTSKTASRTVLRAPTGSAGSLAAGTAVLCAWSIMPGVLFRALPSANAITYALRTIGHIAYVGERQGGDAGNARGGGKARRGGDGQS